MSGLSKMGRQDAPPSTQPRGMAMRFVAVGQEEHYLCAPRPATIEASVGMSPEMPDVTVVWERIELPYERVALRTPYGRFLSCQVEDDQARVTLADDLGPREAFEEILWPDGEVSFRTYELTYVSVSESATDGERSVLCDGTETGAAERFRYIAPPDQLLANAKEIVERQPQVPDMPRQFAHTSEEVPGHRTGNGQG